MDLERTVVVIDSDPKGAEKTATLVRFLGYSVFIATDETEIRQAILQNPEIVAILVAAEPGFNLLARAVQATRQTKLESASILLQGTTSLADAPSAFKSHIHDVIPEDASYKDLLAKLHEASVLHKDKITGESGSSSLLKRNLVGCSRDIQFVHHLVKQVADTEASVLVTGESGTGKEVVAQSIHSLSSRRDHPFVPINCGAIPAELLESELFGHEKGAFTGAVSTRKGRFELAEGGTVFLDEIGDMPLDMQVKLLRVLQERSFERVGGLQTVQANVRVVAATHRNLEQLVAEDKFRMDLFYRLNVFPIEITPLRERTNDVPLLVEDYIRKLEREQGNFLRLSDCAIACLANYYWPGNVRELFNLLERLAILYPQQLVKWADIPDKYRPNEEIFTEQEEELQTRQNLPLSGAVPLELPLDGIDLKPHLAGIERTLMTQALRQSEWVVARAAKLLNLQRTTLVEKMRKFEIQRPEGVAEY